MNYCKYMYFNKQPANTQTKSIGFNEATKTRSPNQVKKNHKFETSRTENIL